MTSTEQTNWNPQNFREGEIVRYEDGTLHEIVEVSRDIKNGRPGVSLEPLPEFEDCYPSWCYMDQMYDVERVR